MRRLTDAILIAWVGASSPPELLTSVFCSSVSSHCCMATLTGTLLGRELYLHSWSPRETRTRHARASRRNPRWARAPCMAAMGYDLNEPFS
jgi:hypothetical protein